MEGAWGRVVEQSRMGNDLPAPEPPYYMVIIFIFGQAKNQYLQVLWPSGKAHPSYFPVLRKRS